jgi:hypothetical protein
MSKKIKLQYPFNDAACLEVEFKPGKWARVTCNHFRSSTGNRRINGELYNGPVYYEGTNHRYLKKKGEPFRLVSVAELNHKLRKPKKVESEIIRFYDRDEKYR